MADETVDLGRRGFLRGRRRPEPAPLRPPWSRTDRFTDLCTRCGACTDSCPEGIVRRGDGGFPEIDFQRGECSFCASCADACPEPVFDRSTAHPWTLAVQVGPSCFATHRIVCRSCRDACPESAIRFALAPGGVAVPTVDDGACTGCGACQAACPADAITLRPGPETVHAP